jgi:hypothetical protein
MFAKCLLLLLVLLLALFHGAGPQDQKHSLGLLIQGSTRSTAW